MGLGPRLASWIDMSQYLRFNCRSMLPYTIFWRNNTWILNSYGVKLGYNLSFGRAILLLITGLIRLLTWPIGHRNMLVIIEFHNSYFARKFFFENQNRKKATHQQKGKFQMRENDCSKQNELHFNSLYFSTFNLTDTPRQSFKV